MQVLRTSTYSSQRLDGYSSDIVEWLLGCKRKSVTCVWKRNIAPWDSDCISVIRSCHSFQALNLLNSSKKSLALKRRTILVRKCHIEPGCCRLYISQCFTVNATSCTAVEPASYVVADIEIVFHNGMFSAQYSNIFVINLIDCSGGKMYASCNILFRMSF